MFAVPSKKETLRFKEFDKVCRRNEEIADDFERIIPGESLLSQIDRERDGERIREVSIWAFCEK